MPITHLKVSAVADGANTDLVQPSDWNANHVLDQYLDFPVQASVPSAPSANNVRVFSRNMAGRSMPMYVDPTGDDIALQATLCHKQVQMWMVTTGTTVAPGIGQTWSATNAGTGAAQASPTMGTGSFLASHKRTNFGTGSTATGSSGIRGGVPNVWRGNASGRGGFYFCSRLGLETWTSGNARLFWGLTSNTTTMAVEPSTMAGHHIVVGFDSTDTHWQVMTRDGTTTTKSNTGLAIAQSQVLDLQMFCAPNDSKITVRVERVDSPSVVVDNVDFTTTLPGSTTFLTPTAQIQSVTTTTAKVMSLMRLYVESET